MNDAAPPCPQRRALTLRGEVFSCLCYPKPRESKAPLLVWVHATGFNAATYRQLLAPLAGRMEVLAPDMRGHGFSEAGADPAELKSWDCYRDDLVALIDELDRPIYLAGHSIGGVAGIGAALERPRRVRGLALVEPVLLSRRRGLWFQALKWLGLSHHFSLAKGAARRRRVFPDKRTALERYRERGVFKTWPVAWVQDYLDGGLRERPDGQVELCCAPAWESRSFAVTAHNMWPRIRRLRCPVTLMTGGHYSTCDPVAERRFVRAQPHTTRVKIPQGSHFLPMEFPRRVRDEILALVFPG